MGKCYTFQDTHFLWCMWNFILYNTDFCWNYFFQMLAYLPYVMLMAYVIANFFDVGCDRCYINNMLEMFMFKRDACLHQLKGILDQDQETLEEWNNLIKKVIECRDIKSSRKTEVKV